MNITDLSRIVAQSETPGTVTIFQPNGDPYRGADGAEATIAFRGPESKQYKEARDAITRRALRQRKSKMEPADLLANRIDLAAAAVTGWSGWESDGVSAACTPENIKAVLRVDHILAQLEDAIAAHGGGDFFTKNSND